MNGVAAHDDRFARTLNQFERIVVVSLIAMLMLVVALSILDLGWILVKDVVTPPVLLLDVDELLELFGFFLLILVGLELLHALKAYLQDNVIRIELVLELALIAIARKIIVLDPSKYEPWSIFGIATLVAAIAGAFFLMRRSSRRSA